MADNPYQLIMWGPEIQAGVNDVVRFRRDVTTYTATLTAAPASGNMPRFIPAGDGGAYDLWQNLADAMGTADAGDTYTVTWVAEGSASASKGITGIVQIDNTLGGLTMLWSDPLTTADPAWFGGAPHPDLFQDESGVLADKAAVGNRVTSDYSSSLVWAPQKLKREQLQSPAPQSVTNQTISLDRTKHVTTKLAKRTPIMRRKFTTIVNGDYDQAGGNAYIDWTNLEGVRVEVANLDAGSEDVNQSLYPFFDHASGGGWFLVTENQEDPFSGTAGAGANTYGNFGLLTGEGLRDFTVLAQRARVSPLLYTVRIDYVVKNADELD